MTRPLVFATRNAGKVVELRQLLPGVFVLGVDEAAARLDLPYAEDSVAEVDMNVVMTDAERLVEIQGTAEHGTFDRAQLDVLCDLAAGGVRQLVAAQRAAIERAK